MDKSTNSFRNITKSKFVRSVFLRVLSIFIIISIAIVAIVFYSFVSEINRNLISERQKQLAVIESTISQRIDEIVSIAYNIGTDPTFHLEPVAGAKYSGYEMSSALARYQVGNSFIEHLAYYRLSEPDKIYVSSGERSFSEFYRTNLGMDQAAAEAYIQEIRGLTRAQVVPRSFGKEGKAYFAYVYPLPQFSANPQAFVLMLISASEVVPLLQSQLLNAKGEVAIFDADGNEIYRLSTMPEDIPGLLQAGTGPAQEYINANGGKYVVQRQVSASNGWTFASVIRLDDIQSGLTSRQVVFILLLLALMLAAILVLLRGIIIQYRPISNLAVSVTDGAEEHGALDVIDERALLSSTIATLQDDSEQKQKFETAYYAAEAASKAKSTFLSSVSHDIRTPMNAIIGMTAIAYKHADDPEYVRECLQKLQISSEYLLAIINNVLDMSKIESGRFTLTEEVIELPRLIDGLVAVLQQNIEQKRQQLIVEVGDITHERVIGDGVRLTQVFVNILSNAVKFTPEGGTVSLRMWETEPTEAGWGDYVFTFSDTGIGMPAEFVERVFETFSRADNAALTQTEGTGLGMAIAKNLVEMMGGRIRCESELDHGTTFTVNLHMKLAPAQSDAIAASPAQPAQARTPPDLTGRHILVAEDNAINREIACTILGETKAEVVRAANGKEALDAFKACPEGYFDLILMDLQMPVMDGYAATAAIRALPRADAASVPIYAMTASTFDEDVRQVRQADMNGHLGKPYMPEMLFAILEQAIGN